MEGVGNKPTEKRQKPKESSQPDRREEKKGRKRAKSKVNEGKPNGDKYEQREDDASMAKEGLEVGPGQEPGRRQNEGERLPGDEGARRARRVKE